MLNQLIHDNLMNNYPTVSVVVPAFNAQNTISDCLDSLQRLEYPRQKLEIIIIDNASTDNTNSILNQYNSQVTILKEAKRGSAAARNKGIINAKGEVIAFTDSDCVVEKDWLKNLVLPLKDDQIGIVGGKVLAKRPCNGVAKFGEFIHDHDAAINKYKPPYVITSNCAMRRDVLLKNNLFDQNFIRGEDCDLSFRILQTNYRLNFCANAVLYHRHESNLLGLLIEGFQHGFWSIKIYKVHKDFIQQFGHKRFNMHSYQMILFHLFQFIRGKNRTFSICYFVFNIGKKIGKLFGSLRFFYVDL